MERFSRKSQVTSQKSGKIGTPFSLAFLTVFCLLTSVFYSHAEEMTAQAQAEAILKFIDRPIGLVHMPNCGNGELAFALLDADRTLRIHAQDPDYNKIQTARGTADVKGYYGRRVWFDQGDLTRLLPVGNSCDLAIMTNLTDKDLTPELAKEISRVLHPWYGMLLMTGEFSIDTLAVWGNHLGSSGLSWQISSRGQTTENRGQKGSGKTDFSLLTSVFSGFLLKAEKPRLPGTDDWPLWWHGPDNNPVSKDSAFRMPETLQWTGKPFYTTRIELPIVADGRLYMLLNGHEMDTTRGAPLFRGIENGKPLLIAQTVGSGSRLWIRELSADAWVQAARPILAADRTKVLIAEGKTLFELAGATGKELRKFEADTDEIKWMTLADGKLFILGGIKTESFGHRSSKAVIPFRSSGLNLIVYDRNTLKELWRIDREPGKGAFDPRSPAITGGKLFICGEDDTAEAFTVENGKPLWKVKAGFERMKIQSYEWDRSSRHPVTGYAMCGVYIISGTEMAQAVVLSQKDGSRLWTRTTKGPSMLQPLAFDNLIWNGRGAGVNPFTGKEEKKLGRIGGGTCGRDTASASGIVGGGGFSYDFEDEKHYPLLSAKSSCMAGQYIADGMLFKFPSPCSNCTEWRGFLVRGTQEHPPVLKQRIYSGNTGTSITDTGPEGWLTYRGNNTRSSNTGIQVSADLKIRWNIQTGIETDARSKGGRVLCDAELPPVPPVIAGNTVIIGKGEGSVCAIDLVSGKQLWKAYTSGRISSSPTIWNARVFVGSADGYLYAFSLKDGSETWRLRAAPGAGRPMVYEQLGSRWPILGSPVVQDGKVYVNAGMLNAVDGVYVICADADTGVISWEQTNWDDSSVKLLGYKDGWTLSGAGHLALGNELILHGGQYPLVRIDESTGTVAPMAVKGLDPKKRYGRKDEFARTSKGQEVGTIGTELVVFGGRRLFTDQAESGTDRNSLTFLYNGEDGKGRFPVVGATDSVLMPAWDEKDIVFYITLKKKKSLALISREKVIKGITDAVNSNPGKGRAEISLGSIKEITWQSSFKYGWGAKGMILTPDAVVVLKAGQKGRGYVLALYSRTDGAVVTQVKLPASPVWDGFAVASDGTVVVACVDGTILAIGRN